MNVVKCSNAHFYDKDTYSECPICGEKEKDMQVKKSRNLISSIFARNNKHLQSETHEEVSFSEELIGDLHTVNSEIAETEEKKEIQTKKDITFDLWQENPKNNIYDDALIENEEGKQTSLDGESSETSLKELVQKASANSGEKTLSYFNTMNSSSTTITYDVDPVVGWLVCISGTHIGESFNIWAGINSIGRDDTNKVKINRDSSISREKHAFITYEPKKRNFYIKPGDSSGLTYLNDEYITETCKLNDKDMIELGNSKFLFVPLCNSTFTWEDYINKE